MYLGQRLIEAQLVTVEQVQAALRAQVVHGYRIGTHLLRMGALDLEDLTTVLSQHVGVPAARIKHFEQADREARDLVSAELALKHRCVPLAIVNRANKELLVAFRDPNELGAHDEIAFVAGARIRAFVAPELCILRYLERFYGVKVDPLKEQAHTSVNSVRARAQSRALTPPPGAPPPAPALRPPSSAATPSPPTAAETAFAQLPVPAVRWPGAASHLPTPVAVGTALPAPTAPARPRAPTLPLVPTIEFLYGSAQPADVAAGEVAPISLGYSSPLDLSAIPGLQVPRDGPPPPARAPAAPRAHPLDRRSEVTVTPVFEGRAAEPSDLPFAKARISELPFRPTPAPPALPIVAGLPASLPPGEEPILLTRPRGPASVPPSPPPAAPPPAARPIPDESTPPLLLQDAVESSRPVAPSPASGPSEPDFEITVLTSEHQRPAEPPPPVAPPPATAATPPPPVAPTSISAGDGAVSIDLSTIDVRPASEPPASVVILPSFPSDRPRQSVAPAAIELTAPPLPPAAPGADPEELPRISQVPTSESTADLSWALRVGTTAPLEALAEEEVAPIAAAPPPPEPEPEPAVAPLPPAREARLPGSPEPAQPAPVEAAPAESPAEPSPAPPTLDEAASADDIAAVLVQHLRSRFGLGLVLIVRNQVGLGWRGFAPGVSAEVLESLTFPLGGETVVGRAFETKSAARGPSQPDDPLEARFYKLLRSEPPTEVLAIPIVLGARVVNLVYTHAHGPLDEAAVAELAGLAGQAAEAYARVIKKKKSGG